MSKWKSVKAKRSSKSPKVQEMAKRSAYRFDYKKAKPNRFAKRMKNELVVVFHGRVRKSAVKRKALKPAKKKKK